MVIRKLILLVGVFALALGMVRWVNRDLESRPFRYQAIPQSLGTYSSEESAVTDLERNILLTDQIFGRKYFGPEGVFFLSMVYYPNGKLNFHHPEGCTTAKGSVLLDRQPVALEGAWEGAQGTYFRILEPSGRSIHYLYAFCTPYQANGDYLAFRKHLALSSLKRGRTACTLVRLSCTGPGDVAAKRAELAAFWKRISGYAKAGFDTPAAGTAIDYAP